MNVVTGNYLVFGMVTPFSVQLGDINSDSPWRKMLLFTFPGLDLFFDEETVRTVPWPPFDNLGKVISEEETSEDSFRLTFKTCPQMEENVPPWDAVRVGNLLITNTEQYVLVVAAAAGTLSVNTDKG
jgi:hypothetical protein